MNYIDPEANGQEERAKLMDSDQLLHLCTREFYNSRTRRMRTNDRIIYFFNYTKENSSDNEEIITWRELNDLKNRHQWQTLRHPMVMNFVNEKLLQQAGFYLAHITSYLIFLLLLSSYIFDKNAAQDLLSTLFLVVFGFCLVVKCAVKLQAGNVSRWFVLSYSFNVTTYIATFLFIWTPQLFAYNDYKPDLKHFITWLLPIIAIISAWINFLYILKKSPYGIYILMLSRILYSFLQIAIIWIPTLLAFAFAFHLVMRNSGQEPWEATEAFSSNSTFGRKLLIILQAITKTSAMMIGEVDADNVLERKEWIPNLLLLAFEITTVILLMNLMISLAVGDVNELRQTAQEKLLQIKISFAIEALQLSESCDCFSTYFGLLHKTLTNNVLTICDNDDIFSTYHSITFTDNNGNQNANNFGQANLEKHKANSTMLPTNSHVGEVLDILNINEIGHEKQQNFDNQFCKVYKVRFAQGDHRLRVFKYGLVGQPVQVLVDGALVQLIESIDSEILPFCEVFESKPIPGVGSNPESYAQKLARWLIGLDWRSLMQL